MYRLLDYGWMLRDRRRIEAYGRALAAAVGPGSVVADLGAGIGTFSVMAAQLGAARIYSVEPSPIIETAAAVARENGVDDRIRFVRARVAEARLAERVDVIVSDLAGALPLFEDHLPSIIHAREQWLAEDGVLIPARDRLFVAPVVSAELYARLTGPWRAVPGVDLSPVAEEAMKTPQALAIEPGDLIAEPRVWAELDYMTLESPDVHGAAAWTLDEEATVYGFALWFESVLHGDVTLTSGPWWPGSIHATMMLPLREPLAVQQGAVLRVLIDCRMVAGRYTTTWQAVIHSDAVRWRIRDGVLASRLGEELVLLDSESGRYHALNETGARVWKGLERGETLARIAAELADEYDVTREQAATDVQEVVEWMRGARLLQEQHDG